MYIFLDTRNELFRKRDIVDIIAPSGKGQEELLGEIAEYVKSLGLNPRIAKDIHSDKDIFYANTNEYRANAFKEALLVEDSKAIWCIRGGKGATEIIPYLEGKIAGFSPLPEEVPNKILIGFSDITALHLFLQNKYGFSSIHGPMLEQIVAGRVEGESVKKLTDILFGEVDLTNYHIDQQIKGSDESIEGETTGGNLTLVEKSVGTDWNIEGKDKIIFLEDVNGAAYQMERSLTHLVQSGLFDEAKAVILGDFIKMIDEDLVPQVRKRFAEKIDIPVFYMEGVGHSEINNPILYSQNYIIDPENLSFSTSLF